VLITAVVPVTLTALGAVSVLTRKNAAATALSRHEKTLVALLGRVLQDRQ
jgi:hypothetical protein